MKAGVGRDSQLIAQVDSGLRRNVQSAQQVDLGFDDLDPRWRCAEIHLPPVPSPNKTRLNCCNYMKENVQTPTPSLPNQWCLCVSWNFLKVPLKIAPKGSSFHDFLRSGIRRIGLEHVRLHGSKRRNCPAKAHLHRLLPVLKEWDWKHKWNPKIAAPKNCKCTGFQTFQHWANSV